MHKKKVIIGFLGTTQDANGGFGDKRWLQWRPTVALFAHEEFQADRLELLMMKEGDHKLADLVIADIHKLRPGVEVAKRLVHIEDPWSFTEVFGVMAKFARNYKFQPDCEYFVHTTTGSEPAKTALFQLTASRYFPAKLLQSRKEDTLPREDHWKGSVVVHDLDLAVHADLTKLLHQEQKESQDLLKGGIVTRNPAYNATIARLEQVAQRSDKPILLLGATGVGKTITSQRLYQVRKRSNKVTGDLIEVDCGTLDKNDANSVFFGHKRGAFTDAKSDRTGVLKLANKGMLFLDEIGELPLDVQAKLLRALESKRFWPMGSDQEEISDFQLIAGTNRDLAEEVRAGRFRADLFARISVWTFKLPSLAERPEDIEPNLDYELERVGREMGMRFTMDTVARAAFLSFALKTPWPDNFRGLAASVTRMATLCDRGRISMPDVQAEVSHLNQMWGTTAPQSAHIGLAKLVLSPERLKQADLFDLDSLESVLRAVHATKSMAAAGRMLFAVSRQETDKPNDTNRVTKFFTRWGLDYRKVKALLSEQATQAA